MPDEAGSEAVIDALKVAGDLKDARVLLPRADIAREVIADQLRARGGRGERGRRPTGRCSPGAERDGDQDVYRMLLDRQIDAVTFTSASTVRNFAKIFGAGAGRRPAARRRSWRRSGRSPPKPRSSSASRRRHAGALHDPGSRRRARRTLFNPHAVAVMSTRTQTPETPVPRWTSRTGPAASAAPPPSARSCAKPGCSPENFLYPLFVGADEGQRREIASMPGVFQMSVDEIVKEAAAAQAEGRARRAAVRAAGNQGPGWVGCL